MIQSSTYRIKEGREDRSDNLFGVMPFSFSPPSTSSLDFTSFLRSDTHPSLIVSASNSRSLLRNALKKYRRLSTKEQAQSLQNLVAAFEDYIPHLMALDAGLSRKSLNEEEIDIILENEIEVEWRPIIAASTSKRIRGRGLDYELSFVLSARACIEVALARNAMQMFFAIPASTPDDRKEHIKKATDHLLHASSIHQYLAGRSIDPALPIVVDITASAQLALSSLALAEATLLSILLHDPYPAIVMQDRDKSNLEWMYKAPDIPKVRAVLFARLAIRSAEYADKASALLSKESFKDKAVDESLMKYLKNLQSVSKAKGCRFFGIDSELGGNVGEGIGWLIAGKKILGYKVNEAEGGKIKTISKMKMEWASKREDKKVEKGGDWGSDAGRIEEARVLDMLIEKWNKANDLVRNFMPRRDRQYANTKQVSTQPVPISDYLVARMPFGRDFHTLKAYSVPKLDSDTLTRMRAPPDEEELETLRSQMQGDSDDENVGGDVPGAFPEPRIEGNSAYY